MKGFGDARGKKYGNLICNKLNELIIPNPSSINNSDKEKPKSKNT